MADTRIQVAVEDWIRDEWMHAKYRRKFYRNRLQLEAGGVFDFDAVSDDKRIATCISTSGKMTAGGKSGSGKMQKIRADMLFLCMTPDIEKRLIILTEEDMYDRCIEEVNAGRTPKAIEFVLATIPDDLRTKFNSSKQVAADEVRKK